MSNIVPNTTPLVFVDYYPKVKKRIFMRIVAWMGDSDDDPSHLLCHYYRDAKPPHGWGLKESAVWDAELGTTVDMEDNTLHTSLDEWTAAIDAREAQHEADTAQPH